MKQGRLGVIGLAVVVSGMLAMAQAPQPQAPAAPARGGQAPRGGGAGAQAPGGRGGGGGRGAQARPRKVLLAWADTRNGQAQHDFTSHALAIIERLGYDSGLWDTYIRTD